MGPGLGQRIAGSMPGTLQPGLPSHWLPYSSVEGADASTELANSLGAMIYHGPDTIEAVGRFTVLADP
jgi:predicted enzyme related to lactoylglutathione lyase